ncbi:MAG TPA: site-2 protease family protein [Isosphaeraceae bacterium]|nr:site-2 protease family protein [Isosphaeraceae bacterium]
MAWSWKLGRIAGIPIYVHWTFLILIAWVILGYWLEGQTLAATVQGVGFVLALFGCVVLHELGHALAARRYGVPTADITLLPIGGVARLQRIPEHPRQELVVALAGPAVNIAIVAGLYLAGVGSPVRLNDPQQLVRERFWPKLLEVNLFLALFNLLPAFPMDGGRVFRALLAMRLDYARATRLAASVGQLMAIGFGLLGLTGGNPILLLIALFVWIGAESEAVQVEERLVLKDVPVRAAMITEFMTLMPYDTLGRAADLLLAGSQHDFPVAADGRVAGLLTRADLINGLTRGGRDARVADFAKTGLGTVEAGAPLISAVARLRQGEGPCLQVVEHGQPVGLLTLENIGEYVMVRAALAGAASKGEQAALARTFE